MVVEVILGNVFLVLQHGHMLPQVEVAYSTFDLQLVIAVVLPKGWCLSQQLHAYIPCSIGQWTHPEDHSIIMAGCEHFTINFKT
jgi:hypothetical protein